MASSSDLCCYEGGCWRKGRQRGLCVPHHAEAKANGTLQRYSLRREHEPEPFVRPNGYVQIYQPGHVLANAQGHVYLHRLVAWEAFGPFDPSMHVHHKDHDRTNNDPTNLEIVTAEEHGRRHRVHDRNQALDLYESGLSTIEVARVMGTHAGNVSRFIREAGGSARRAS